MGAKINVLLPYSPTRWRFDTSHYFTHPFSPWRQSSCHRPWSTCSRSCRSRVSSSRRLSPDLYSTCVFDDTSTRQCTTLPSILKIRFPLTSYTFVEELPFILLGRIWWRMKCKTERNLMSPQQLSSQLVNVRAKLLAYGRETPWFILYERGWARNFE